MFVGILTNSEVCNDSSSFLFAIQNTLKCKDLCKNDLPHFINEPLRFLFTSKVNITVTLTAKTVSSINFSTKLPIFILQTKTMREIA